jgi:drug/metabolite transporter (DMT)-like permease
MSVRVLQPSKAVKATRVARFAHVASNALQQMTWNASRLQLIMAFAAVYLIWGSTYLAIRVAIDTLPPFLMAATRFLLAGGVLFVLARQRGAPRPTAVHWRTALIVGGLMLLGGNGGVVWAEQTVPSSLAALLVATIPLWVASLASLAKRRRPSLRVMASTALGLTGIALLVGPEQLAGGESASLAGVTVLLFAALSWSLGTLFSRNAPQPDSPFMSTALNMLGGGLMLAVVSGGSGELSQLDLSGVSLASLLALGYLAVFGSLVAYSAYMWLVKVTPPAQAASNFYVNPVVAVILGWLLAGEALTLRTILVTAVIRPSPDLVDGEFSEIDAVESKDTHRHAG